MFLTSLQATDQGVVIIPPTRNIYSALPKPVDKIAHRNNWSQEQIDDYLAIDQGVVITPPNRNITNTNKDLNTVKAVFDLGTKVLGCCTIMCPCWLLFKDCRDNLRICCSEDPEETVKS